MRLPGDMRRIHASTWKRLKSCAPRRPIVDQRITNRHYPAKPVIA
jgi:hypothetical protein